MNTKKWVARQSKDLYVKRKNESTLFNEYYARSAFKLIEMNQKFKFLKPNMKVVDFGCAPGSWSQVLLERKCNVIGYDLLDCELSHPKFQYHKKDISLIDPTTLTNIDFIVSDMAPNLTGNKARDISSSIELNSMLLQFVKKNTIGLVCKAFQSPWQIEFESELSHYFSSIKKFKPKSSRKESPEYYYFATR